MFVFGMVGGVFWVLILVVLKMWFNINEIFISLMLVYVVSFLLDYLVCGFWCDLDGFNFLELWIFLDVVILFEIFGGMMSFVVFIMVGVVVVLVVVLVKIIKGFEIWVMGESLWVGVFVGFFVKCLILFFFVIVGVLVGLVGMMEVLGVLN